MKKILFFLTLFLSGFFAFLPSVQALVISDQETVTIGPDEVINDDLFVAGGTVTLAGTVNGNVFMAGGVISLEGTVAGDVVVTGGNLTISGTVKDDVWAAGGNIQITQAQIGDGLLVAGGMVLVDEQTTVGGSLLAAGGSISNLAAVGKNFFAGGGEVRLDAPVGGEVRLAGGQLIIGEKTAVGGDLIYETGENFDLSPHATVSGTVRKSESLEMGKMSPEARKAAAGIFKGARSAFRFWSFLSALAVGFILLVLFPQPAAEIGRRLSVEPLKAALAGLVTLVLVGPAVLILIITVIGIPLGLILTALFGVYLYLAKILAAIALGEGLKKAFGKKKLSPYASFGLGLLVYYFLLVLPFLGFLTRMAAGSIGLGAAYLYWRPGKRTGSSKDSK